MLYENGEVYSVLSTRKERFLVVSPVMYVRQNVETFQRMRTHESRSCLTTRRIIGLGFIVSKFPRGICKTKLIVLGTAVTMREPRSTRRLSQLWSSEVPPSVEPLFEAKNSRIEAVGAK